MKVDGDFGSELDGDIITRTNQQPVVEGELNTLDEPIMDTIVSFTLESEFRKSIMNDLFCRNET